MKWRRTILKGLCLHYFSSSFVIGRRKVLIPMHNFGEGVSICPNFPDGIATPIRLLVLIEKSFETRRILSKNKIRKISFKIPWWISYFTGGMCEHLKCKKKKANFMWHKIIAMLNENCVVISFTLSEIKLCLVVPTTWIF